MDREKSELEKDFLDYFRARSLYNRLVGIEEDVTKFVPKDTDFDTMRKALVIHGVVLKHKIETETGGDVAWE